MEFKIFYKRLSKTRNLRTYSLYPLYDSSKVPAFTLDEYSSYWKRVDLPFGEGGTYYIVVYCPENQRSRGTYTITVGDRRLYYNYLEQTVSPSQVTAGNIYTLPFTLRSPTGEAAYADKIVYRAKNAAWAYEGGYFEVLTPGTTRWRTNSPQYSQDMKFDFSDLNTSLVRADGEWSVRFTAAKSGTYPGAIIDLYYYYEV